MAVRTSVGSGNWSAAGTWDTGVPADGDSFVIAAGHEVVIDAAVDMSGYASGVAGGAVNGTLRFGSDAGTRNCKWSGTITVANGGSLLAGTSTVIPLPSTAIIKNQINHTGNGVLIQSGATIGIYCTEPEIKIVKLTAQANSGANTLAVDTDVSGIWQVGDYVWVGRANAGYNNLNDTHYVIQDVTADTITLTGNLNTNKEINSRVVLLTRNIEFESLSGANGIQIVRSDSATVTINCYALLWGAGTGQRFSLGNHGTPVCTLGGVLCGAYTGSAAFVGSVFNAGNKSISLDGAVICRGFNGHNASSGYIYSNECYWVGNVYPFIQGILHAKDSQFLCNYHANGGNGAYFDDCVISHNRRVCDGTPSYGATYNGCAISNTLDGDATFNVTNRLNILNCSITGSGTIFSQCDALIVNSTIGGLVSINAGRIRAYNCTISGTTQVANYSLIIPNNTIVAYNISGVPGCHKAWMAGGRVLAQGSVVPTGYTVAHQFVCEQAANAAGVETPVWLDIPINAYENKKVTITTEVRSDTAFASMTEAFRVQIVDLGNDPLFGGTALAETVASGAADTWHTLTTEYTPVADMQNLVVRFYGRNASGNNYAAWDIETEGVDVYYYSDNLTANITEDAITVDITD